MVNCPNCDIEIGENIKFCTTCGTKIEPIQDISQENNSEILCPNCSAQLPANTRFCIDCGTKIENLNVPNQEIICPKCSVENPAGTKFCKECGTPIKPKVSRERKERKPEDEVDKIIKEATTAGKGLLKEADSLLKRFR